MDFEFAVTDHPAAVPVVALKSVYHLMADASYDVWTGDDPGPETIALRTLGGRGELETRDAGIIQLQAGTLLIIAYRDIRRYRRTDGIWEFWWMSYTGGTGLGASGEIRRIDAAPVELRYCRGCLDRLGSPDRRTRLLASADLGGLLAYWNAVDSGVRADATARSRIVPVIELIRASYRDELHIPELASRAGLSVRRFQDLFGEVTGKTPSRYIRDVRLSAAREYLVNTTMKVRDIALSTGFSDEYYFSKCFRAAFGRPPGRYRRGA